MLESFKSGSKTKKIYPMYFFQMVAIKPFLRAFPRNSQDKVVMAALVISLKLVCYDNEAIDSFSFWLVAVRQYFILVLLYTIVFI